MPAPPTIEFTRHFHTLSEKETGDVVEAVADLIVNFFQRRRDSAPSVEQRQTHEREVKQ